eukprot:298476_1
MSESTLITILSYLCSKYPEMMTMRNTNGEIPLYLSIKEKSISKFYCLCRLMTDNKIDIKSYLREKLFVQAMIEFGSYSMNPQNKCSMYIKLLLSTFDYPEIFRWSSQHDAFTNDNDSIDVSLIKYVSKQSYKDSIDSILFNKDKCLVNPLYQNEKISLEQPSDNSNDDTVNNNNDSINTNPDEIHDSDDEDKEEEEELDANMEDNQKTEKQKEIIQDEESTNWYIELLYSTIVETFSALD